MEEVLIFKMKNNVSIIGKLIGKSRGTYSVKEPYLIQEGVDEEGKVIWSLFPYLHLSEDQITTFKRSDLLFDPIRAASEVSSYYSECVQVGNQVEIPKILRSISLAAHSLEYTNAMKKEFQINPETDSLNEINYKIQMLQLLEWPMESFAIH